ncbi:hypothetical protein PC118_g5869 [Phytophthora cactorum]|uniref:Peptidase S1 domain-containing protein n=1 Tax=Phytophthora cactorum TaxID=29920 RepID=A0A8T1GAT5_9STRA|nr:hypothetical protein PC118_g5869 [Phytophthora cactorum]
MFGGSNADIKNHPYVAELLAKSIDDEPFCGGTLIAPQYVLTAVSCLAWLPFDMHVSLGGQKNKGRSSRKAEQIRVVETYRHPVFNSTWLPYDVALLKLKKPSTHKPARLCDADGSDNKPGTMASVFGAVKLQEFLWAGGTTLFAVRRTVLGGPEKFDILQLNACHPASFKSCNVTPVTATLRPSHIFLRPIAEDGEMHHHASKVSSRAVTEQKVAAGLSKLAVVVTDTVGAKGLGAWARQRPQQLIR